MKIKAKELLSALAILNESVDKTDPILFGKFVEGEYIFSTGNGDFATDVTVDIGKSRAVAVQVDFFVFKHFLFAARDSDVVNIRHVKEGAGKYLVEFRNHSISLHHRVAPSVNQLLLRKKGSTLTQLKDPIDVHIFSDVYHAVDKNGPKLELNGMLFDFPKNKLVGTDGFRLGVRDILPTAAPLPPLDSFIVPKVALRSGETIRIVKLNTQNRIIEFLREDGSVRRSNLMGGKYSNYNLVTASTFEGEVKFNGDDMVEALLGKGDVELIFTDRKITVRDVDNNATSVIASNYRSEHSFSVFFKERVISDRITQNETSIKLADSLGVVNIDHSWLMPMNYYGNKKEGLTLPSDFKAGRFQYTSSRTTFAKKE